MKKSILITSAVLAGITLLGASTFAASSTSTGTLKNKIRSSFSQSGQTFGPHMGGGHGGPMMEQLTEAEKTAFEALSDSEKKAFIDKKRTEMEAKMEAQDAVIDKLLAGISLNTTEESLRQEIIKDRALMKTKRAEMKAQMEKVKAILDKKATGATLTVDEQAVLDSMPKMGEKGSHGKGEKRGNR